MMTTIPLADLKAFLNVEGAADDGVLAEILAAGEAMTDRFLTTPLAARDPLEADLKLAVMLVCGHFYNNREASTSDLTVTVLPIGFYDLIRAYRGWRF